MSAGVGRKRERTCIGCGRKDDKATLLRIVRCSDETVRFDARGNEAGRGAYVCSRPCFDKAFEQGKLKRALRTAIGPEQAQAIGADIEAACVAKER